MRILIHTPHPDMPTGYASQSREIAPRLAKAGHDVGISCTAGVVRFNTTWRGLPVYGRSPYTDMAEDLVQGNYDDFGAELIITLCCPWKLHGMIWRDMRTIHLMPIDRAPLGRPDYNLLIEGGGMPAAVSRFGEAQLRDQKLEPLYLPHAVDTSQWVPPSNRIKLRKEQGVHSVFVVGMNAANTDPDDRKSFFESFAGFAAFHEKHPKSILTVHAAPNVPDGINLKAIAHHFGISDAVIFPPDQYKLASAGTADNVLAGWYGTLDVLLMPSKGEGYGVPLAEAQSCGTPVITMGWSTGPELAGPGWTVQGQPTWHNGHTALWYTPYIASITAALEEAYESAGDRRQAARDFAVANLDYDTLWAEHWAPLLETL